MGTEEEIGTEEERTEEETKYVLVEWPESQEYMERDDVFLCQEQNGALFVPENVRTEKR